MRTILILLSLLALTPATTRADNTDTDEPIQPVLRADLSDNPLWRGQFVFHRTVEGELVLLGRGGPEAIAMLSGDEGRTWRRWPDTMLATSPSGYTRRWRRLGKRPRERPSS